MWESKGVRWSRSQIRAYNMLLPVLSYCLRKGLMVHWVTLTSAKDGDAKNLWVHHRELLTRIEKNHGEKPGYIAIETGEGHGVLHVFWFWPSAASSKNYVPYQWLSDNWKEIHGAWHVNLRRVGGKGQDALKVARYACAQYAAGQSQFIACRSSRALPVPVDPRKLFPAVKRHFKWLAWPCVWTVDSRTVREAVLSLYESSKCYFNGRQYIYFDGGLVEL